MPSNRVNANTLSESQAQGETTANTYLARLENFFQATVIDRDLTTAPGSPANGDTYITAGTGGAWSPFAIGSLVTYFNGWLGCTPKSGFQAYIVDEKIPVEYSAVESAWFPRLELWSTTEHWTGQYREGSKVYSKSFTFSSVAGGLSSQAHGISGLLFTRLQTAQYCVLNSGSSFSIIGPLPDLGGHVVGFSLDATNLTIDYYGAPASGSDVKVRLTYCR